MKTKTLSSLALLTFVPFALLAQDQPVEKNDEDTQFDLIVVKGQKYRAETSKSASRVAIPINKMPVSVQVFTGEAVDDFKLVTQRDALQFSSSVNDKAVRGFNTGEFFRNGFTHLSDSPGFTIDRIEVVKGPTATLNGPATPGGAINTISKKAMLDEQFGEVDSFWGFSENNRDNNGLSVDFNMGDMGIEDAGYGSIAAFRFVGGIQKDTGFGSKTNNEMSAILPSLQLRPYENTLIDLEYYQYTVNTDRTDRPFGIELTIPGQTPGTEVPLALAYDIDPRASYFGSTTDIEESVRDWSGAITQSLMDEHLLLSLSYNRHNRDFIFGPGNRPRIDIFYNILPRDDAPEGTTDPDDFQLRRLTEELTLLNNIDQLTGFFTYMPDNQKKHRIIGGFNTSDQDQRLTIKRPRASGQTSGFYFEYFDIESVNNSNLDFNAAGEDIFFTPVLDREREIDQSSYYLNYQGELLDDRLNLLLGVTYSDIEIYQTNLRSNDGRVGLSDSEEWLLQIGAVYEVVDGFSVYGNFSQSQLPDLNDPDFEQAPPVRIGDQLEFGIKYSLFDRKLNGSIGYFQIDEVVRGEENDRDVEARGFDLEMYYEPIDNFTAVLSYSYVDTEVTASGSSTFIVGTPLVDEIPSKFALWTKYDFQQDLVGLTIGGGFTYTGKGVRPTAAAAQSVKMWNGSVLRYEPVTRLDVFAQYEFDTDNFGIQVSLNLKNLTKEDNISSVVPLVPLQGGLQADGSPYSFDGSIEAMLGLKVSY